MQADKKAAKTNKANTASTDKDGNKSNIELSASISPAPTPAPTPAPAPAPTPAPKPTRALNDPRYKNE